MPLSLLSFVIFAAAKLKGTPGGYNYSIRQAIVN